MSPARRRFYVFVNVLIAVGTTWFAVRVVLTDSEDTARVLLASAGAACFVGLALFGVRMLWREEHSPTAES